MTVSEWIAYVDQRVWGPGMLVLLMGTGVFLTLRTRFLPWRNLGWALKSVLGRDSRAKAGGAGDVSPFSALMTTLAATIGTGNIVGVATALVAGGPRRLGVDGDLRPLRPFLQVRGVPAGRQVPPAGRRRRNARRPHVYHVRRPAVEAAGRCPGLSLRPLHSPGLPGHGGHGPGQFHRRGAGRQLLRSGPDHRGGSGSAGSRGHSGRYPADCRSLLRGGAPHGGPLPAGGHRSAAGASVRSARSRGRDVPPAFSPAAAAAARQGL